MLKPSIDSLYCRKKDRLQGEMSNKLSANAEYSGSDYVQPRQVVVPATGVFTGDSGTVNFVWSVPQNRGIKGAVITVRQTFNVPSATDAEAYLVPFAGNRLVVYEALTINGVQTSVAANAGRQAEMVMRFLGSNANIIDGLFSNNILDDADYKRHSQIVDTVNATGANLLPRANAPNTQGAHTVTVTLNIAPSIGEWFQPKFLPHGAYSLQLTIDRPVVGDLLAKQTNVALTYVGSLTDFELRYDEVEFAIVPLYAQVGNTSTTRISVIFPSFTNTANTYTFAPGASYNLVFNVPSDAVSLIIAQDYTRTGSTGTLIDGRALIGPVLGEMQLTYGGTANPSQRHTITDIGMRYLMAHWPTVTAGSSTATDFENFCYRPVDAFHTTPVATTGRSIATLTFVAQAYNSIGETVPTSNTQVTMYMVAMTVGLTVYDYAAGNVVGTVKTST